MAEPTLTQTFVELQREVGYFLGWGRTDGSWTTAQLNRIKDYVNAGLRQFLLPPAPEGQESHRWSFMRAYAGTINTVNGTTAYDLPDDWGGGTEAFHWAVAEDRAQIPVVSNEELVAIRGEKSVTSVSTPLIAAIRAKPFVPATGQRYEVLLHPTPADAKPLTFNYSVDIDKLATDGHFTPGGAAHSETLLQSCLAVAELRTHDEAGVHNARFMERLAASILYDKTNIVPTATTWPEDVDDPADGSLTFPQLAREVGGALNYGRNLEAWSRDQREEVYSVVNRGYRRFLQPDNGHAWSFLTQEGSLSLLNTVGDYDLPSDFAGIIEGAVHF